MDSNMDVGWFASILGAESVDQRTIHWYLVSDYRPTLLLTLFYLLAVWLGPKLMQNYSPWQLRKLIVLYNFSLVIFSFLLCIEVFYVTILNPEFKKFCTPIDTSEDDKAMRLAAASWWFYISKAVELADTIIFILRKKNNQISFLHVYHHCSVLSIWWLTTKYFPGGAVYSGMLINTAVHTIMYAYYMLAAMGEKMQKYLWWKKYVTKIQLMQFFVLGFHSIYLVYTDCGFPVGYAILLLIWDFSLILLFANFYTHTYKPKQHFKQK